MKIPPFFPYAVPNVRNCLSKSGAQTLAAAIEARWHACGHHQVKAWVQSGTVNPRDNEGLYFVRTNLISGLPPKDGEPLWRRRG